MWVWKVRGWSDVDLRKRTGRGKVEVEGVREGDGV